MARAPKVVCLHCQARITEGISFCPSCMQPTRWASHEERIGWEVEQWRRTKGLAPRGDVHRVPMPAPRRREPATVAPRPVAVPASIASAPVLRAQPDPEPQLPRVTPAPVPVSEPSPPPASSPPPPEPRSSPPPRAPVWTVPAQPLVPLLPPPVAPTAEAVTKPASELTPASDPTPAIERIVTRLDQLNGRMILIEKQLRQMRTRPERKPVARLIRRLLSEPPQKPAP